MDDPTIDTASGTEPTHPRAIDPSHASATDDALLAAVHDEVIDYGVRRATATSIAKRAGVSRMTVYRRGGGVKQLVLDALSREFDTLLRQALLDGAAMATATVRAREADEHGADAGGIPTTRDHLAAAVVLGVRALAGSTLVHALLRHDPDLLVPYLVDRHGHSQQAFIRDVTPVIAAGIADGSIRAGDPRIIATVLLQAAQGFVVSSDILRRELDAAALETELEHLIQGYLRPQPTDPQSQP